MMDANLMRLMSLEHLLAAAEAEQDSLTRTPLETELIRRINELQDEQELCRYTTEDGTELSDDEIEAMYGATIDGIDNTVALLEVLGKHRVSAKDDLDARLGLAKFAIDLGNQLTDETLTELSVFFNQLAERK